MYVYKPRLPVEVVVITVLEALSEEHETLLQKKVANETLMEKERAEVEVLLQEYSKVWTCSGVGQAKGVEMKIDTIDERPVAVPSRHIAQAYQKPLEEYITKILPMESLY